MTTTLANPATAAQRIDELGRIILAYSEITEKLQQSHERLESQVRSLHEELGEKNRLLERRNRLAALGEMAAGMAHEIRNPLGGIQLYASMLDQDLADRPESRRIVLKIATGVKRLEQVVSQVLQFSREMTATRVAMDLSETVEQAVELVRGELSALGTLVTVTGPRPMPVSGDPLLLGQALMNLLLNAAQAMAPGGGEALIEYGPPAAGDEPARQFVLSVRDRGPGIAPGVMDKLFNPFFTTRETGTGLGLAIVHRVVESHDGTITARNAADGGARFEMRI